jgi:non-ribosomal peptide synthase protein (TIGR01720 family)
VPAPEPPTPLSAWAEHLASVANSSAVEADRAWWQAELGRPAGTLPLEDTAGLNHEQDLALWTEWLDEQTTEALLRDVPRVLGHDLHDVLVAALGLVVSHWSGSYRVRIDCERHGRTSRHVQLDASRTTGWLTSIAPALLDFPPVADAVTAVSHAAAQCGELPDNGFTYGLLRYLSSEPLIDPAPGQVLFNYLGRMDQGPLQDGLFQLVSTSAGQTRHLENQRWYLIEIDAEVVGARLRLEWRHAGRCFAPATIERHARAFAELLARLCQAAGQHA